MDSPSAQPNPAVDVSAGLIFDSGRLLITRRYPDADFGGLWEFPGGKREPDESFESALCRELKEELGIQTAVGSLIESVLHTYPDKTVRIRFYRCEITDGEPQALGCHALKWVHREELADHSFPGADARLLDRLMVADDLWAGDQRPAK
jgi:mutator protein MutT